LTSDLRRDGMAAAISDRIGLFGTTIHPDT
jgi:hypothetical protein